MKKVIITIIIIVLVGLIAFRLYSNKQKNAEEVAIVAQKEAQVAVRAAKVAEEKGLMPVGITQSIREMCLKFGLPVEYENWDLDKLYQALTHDKKARGNTLKLVLVPELGSATIHPVSLEEMRDYLVK